MTEGRPSAIKATHLARKAKVYMRQSTEMQVERHQGSTESQRGQVAFAREWGWTPEQIDVVDSDLGLSGAATEHRPGYKRMVEEIRAGEVGIVLCTDLSRVGRDASDVIALLRDCCQHDVLLANDGRVYDLNDPTDRFMSQLTALGGEFDGSLRRGHLERGRFAKIQAGRTVTQPPAGYVRLPDSSWIQDPDPAVREGIRAVFRAFLEARSLRGAVRLLTSWGARIPRKKTGCPVHWDPPTVPAVQSLIKNPAYTGDYVWGQRRSDPRRGRDKRGHLRVRLGNPEEMITNPDHHEPYVTREDWQAIQTILRENRWNGRCPGGLGRGGALLQGLMRCGLHRGWRMAPVYKPQRANGTRPHAYRCIGDHHYGGDQCGARPGLPLDAAVVSVALQRLAPPRIEAIEDAWRQARGDERSRTRYEQEQLRLAEREVDVLWERFMTVDPDNRLVRAELERRLERAKARVEALRRNTAPQPSALDLFDHAAFEELRALAQDPPAIWHAETTTNKERKEILRALITSVVVVRFDRATIELAIEWADGTPSSRVTVQLPPHVHRRIRDLHAQGLDTAAIADRLNEEGLPTKYLTRWTSAAVHRALARMRRKGLVQ